MYKGIEKTLKDTDTNDGGHLRGAVGLCVFSQGLVKEVLVLSARFQFHLLGEYINGLVV